ncbi:hypothetical protein ILYODFUR_008356 [Ilyodon furcidens]|uniref:Uncharacterized protein n=1 Tax=Ilyodon furcidens TaxID=33524 RepID=A0ABV0TGY6_9TELE
MPSRSDLDYSFIPSRYNSDHPLFRSYADLDHLFFPTLCDMDHSSIPSKSFSCPGLTQIILLSGPGLTWIVSSRSDSSISSEQPDGVRAPLLVPSCRSPRRPGGGLRRRDHSLNMKV